MRVEKAIAQLKEGGMIILFDNEDRENEGDLVCAADLIDAAKINFMAQKGRGLICLAMAPELISLLQLPMMQDPSKGPGRRETAFTVSIEAKDGITTGISAADRAHTVRTAVSPSAKPEDIVVPGHIFPLRSRPGGVLVRAGHTEGSVDLCRLAGRRPAAVICEIMREDGTMARRAELEALANHYGIPMVTIPEIIQYRFHQEKHIELVSEGTFLNYRALLFRSIIDSSTHVALVKGAISGFADVRVQVSKPLLDALDQSRSSLGLQMLEKVEVGVYLLLAVEASSWVNDFANLVGSQSMRASVDQRSIGLGAQILHELGVKRMRIHTRSNVNYLGLQGFGLEIVEQKVVDS